MGGDRSQLWTSVVLLVSVILSSVSGRMNVLRDYTPPSATTTNYVVSTMTSVSYGYPSSTSVDVPNLPKKPVPAPGQPAITNNSYTSTTGLPYDFFTGVSLRQLDVVRTQITRIFQLAAQSANARTDQGEAVFAAILGQILSLWFPEDAKKIGLPYNSNGTDGGGQVTTTKTFWENDEALRISAGYAKSIRISLDHILAFDSVGYARTEDDQVYQNYLQLRSYGLSIGDVISLYLHNTIQQTGTIDFVLGSEFTDEIHSAFKTVLRFINWHAATVIDLYQRGIYSRFEGPQNSACTAISPLELIPAEQNYSIMTNSTAIMMRLMQYGNSTSKTGPVNPDGTPKKVNIQDRQYSDHVPAGLGYTTHTDESSQTTTAVRTDKFSQPKPADGATPQDPPPYSATAGKKVDSFSGISYDQLAVGFEAWRNVTRAAAVASGVEEQDGAKIFVKQSYYIFLSWHAEYSGITNYQSIEDIWTNATIDAGFSVTASYLENLIIGLTQRNPAMVRRLIDETAFTYYQSTRSLGVASETLAFFAFTTDSDMEAAKFFLGDNLSDEAYSALESIFSFLNLKSYQVYHAYNNGYRQRPFADDWEMIGCSA